MFQSSFRLALRFCTTEPTQENHMWRGCSTSPASRCRPHLEKECSSVINPSRPTRMMALLLKDESFEKRGHIQRKARQERVFKHGTTASNTSAHLACSPLVWCTLADSLVPLSLFACLRETRPLGLDRFDAHVRGDLSTRGHQHHRPETKNEREIAAEGALHWFVVHNEQ